MFDVFGRVDGLPSEEAFVAGVDAKAIWQPCVEIDGAEYADGFSLQKAAGGVDEQAGSAGGAGVPGVDFKEAEVAGLRVAGEVGSDSADRLAVMFGEPEVAGGGQLQIDEGAFQLDG